MHYKSLYIWYDERNICIHCIDFEVVSRATNKAIASKFTQPQAFHELWGTHKSAYAHTYLDLALQSPYSFISLRRWLLLAQSCILDSRSYHSIYSHTYRCNDYHTVANELHQGCPTIQGPCIHVRRARQPEPSTEFPPCYVEVTISWCYDVTSLVCKNIYTQYYPPIDGTKITEPKMAHACSAIETLKNDRPGFPQHMTSIRRVHENSHVAKMPSMWMWSYINKCLDYVEKHRKPSKTNMAVVTRRHGCMVIYHDLCRM